MQHVLVASIDAAGKTSVYFPFGGNASGLLSESRNELPDTIVLDDTLGPERIFAFYSREQFAALLTIKTAKRFVQNHQSRICFEQSPTQTHALTFAARYQPAAFTKIRLQTVGQILKQ